ncbi:MAG: efflux RND transporter periplasmic adaptor subunit [Aestuariibacter sp.]
MKFAQLISIATILLVSACTEQQIVPEQVIRPIAWQQVTTSEFEQIRRLSGTLQPVESTDLSFEVGGKIKAIKVDLGDHIKQGQVIAELDQRTYRLSLQSAEANLQQAQSGFDEASNEFSRYEELIEKGLVSKSGFDNIKAAYESAVSAVNIAKAQLDIAKKDLSDTELQAPYDGQITKRLVEPSMQISPGQPVFEIEGQGGFEVKVMVPETLISVLNKGRRLNISFPAIPFSKVDGLITEIGTRAESANAFPVNVLIQGGNPQLRAGMTAEVDFIFEGIGRTGHTGQIFRIPIAAVMPGSNQETFVFIYDEESSTVSKRKIQTENLLNNEVLVSSGLQPGEIIATAGVNFLRDGQEVRLLDKHIRQYN